MVGVVFEVRRRLVVSDEDAGETEVAEVGGPAGEVEEEEEEAGPKLVEVELVAFKRK